MHIVSSGVRLTLRGLENNRQHNAEDKKNMAKNRRYRIMPSIVKVKMVRASGITRTRAPEHALRGGTADRATLTRYAQTWITPMCGSRTVRCTCWVGKVRRTATSCSESTTFFQCASVHWSCTGQGSILGDLVFTRIGLSLKNRIDKEARTKTEDIRQKTDERRRNKGNKERQEETKQDRTGKQRNGKERKGKERKGKERKGKERKGKERKGKERKGKERKGKESGN